MSETKQSPRDGAESWVPNMQAPSAFDRAAYQKRIDEIVGTRDGRPIVMLAWAPSEFRWMPHRLPSDPPGYTLPIFCVGRNHDGEFVAPPRWVLLQRAEPQHYASSWELGRYSVHDGSVWDWKGPCPSERYTELRAHCYHDGECCPCHGETCECLDDYLHCWGKYLEPNESLLDWIRKTNFEAQSDNDVDPNRRANEHIASNAQRQWLSDQQVAEEKRIIAADEIDRDVIDFFRRQPVSRRTESGLYLPD